MKGRIEVFDLILIIITIVGAIVGVLVGIRTQLKRPHILFSLFKKAEISIYNEENEEKISLLSAPIANEKKQYFGDVAKKVSALVLYRAPTNDGKLGLNASIDLPWLDSYGTRIRIVGQLKTEKDVQRALENYLFDRKERDIPQGRGEHLAVAYGIKKVNKLFLASNPPIEILLPPPKKRGKELWGCFLALEVAGENLASTVSDGTMIIADRWNNLTFPKKVTTLKTSSKIRNLLLRMGVGREVKVLGSKSHQED